MNISIEFKVGVIEVIQYATSSNTPLECPCKLLVLVEANNHVALCIYQKIASLDGRQVFMVENVKYKEEDLKKSN